MKGLILDKLMVGVHLGLSQQNPKADATQRTALLEQMKTESVEYEAQLRDCLGEASY